MSDKTKHMAIIGGVIGTVLTVHKATPVQTLAAVGIGLGVYNIIGAAITRRKK